MSLDPQRSKSGFRRLIFSLQYICIGTQYICMVTVERFFLCEKPYTI